MTIDTVEYTFVGDDNLDYAAIAHITDNFDVKSYYFDEKSQAWIETCEEWDTVDIEKTFRPAYKEK